ncbi:MAG: PAS domain S-box protein [Microcoleus sp.]
MLEKIFQYLQTLQEQASELPPAQQAIFTNTLENLSNSLQELAASRQFESATNNADRVVQLEKSHRILERTVAKQASRIRQLQEQLQKEISQYRRDNQALIKSQAKLQIVLRNSPDIISILESDGRVRYHSAAVERVLGYKAESRIGKVHGELIHPDDWLAWQAYFGWLLEHPGVAKPIEYRERHADGFWLYMEAVGNSLLQDYNVHGVILNSRPIGERKQVELQLQLAGEVLQAQIESAPLAINCTDTKGQVTVWNRAAEKLFGWSATEVLGQYPPNIPEREQEDFHDILKLVFNGKAQNGWEVSLLKKDGGSIDLWLFAAPVQDASGRIIGSIKIFSDLSERKRIELERQKLAGLQNMEEPFWVRYVAPPKSNKKESN